MEPHEKNLINSTLKVYRESPEKRKVELLEKLEWNLKEFPNHKNVNATKIFLRIVKNK